MGFGEVFGEFNGVLCSCRGSTPFGWTFARLTVFQTVSISLHELCMHPCVSVLNFELPSFLSSCCHDNPSSLYQQVAKQLGLDRCHHHLTGAAPLSSETLRYFLSLNILLHKLYGMTETTGPTTVTTEKTLRFGSNGYAIAGADIKIEDPDEDGVGEVSDYSTPTVGRRSASRVAPSTCPVLRVRVQVVISGRNVFMGYLHNAEKTRQVFTKEGYLRSGDCGYLDKDKHLYITGRIKGNLLSCVP